MAIVKTDLKEPAPRAADRSRPRPPAPRPDRLRDDPLAVVIATVLARRQRAAAEIARAAEDLALWDRLLRELGQPLPLPAPARRRPRGRPRTVSVG
jgi:hypothetical protein